MTYVIMVGMVLDIIILSVLRSGPVHGYELKQRVQRPTLTALSNNSLYPALKRFELAGAVESTVENQEGKPARKVYRITPRGRQLFKELISTLPVALAGNDEEFLVRLSFFDEIDPADRQSILDARAEVLDGKIAQVRALVVTAHRPPPESWRPLATGHFLSVLETERRWVSDLASVELEKNREQYVGA